MMTKDDFVFSQVGRREWGLVLFLVLPFAFVFLMFTVHGAWQAGFWEEGGLEKEQMGGLS